MSNPWVGLRPFGVDDEELFFGRRREIQIVRNLVATLPTLIVYAPSGTGKSSLINAGLAPLLLADQTQVLVLINDPKDDVLATVRARLAESGWSVPEEVDLATLLHRHWEDTDRRVVVVVDQFEERLNAGTEHEHLYDAAATMAHTNSDAGCLVISIREDYLGNLEPMMRRIPGLLDGSYRVPPLRREALVEAVYGPLANVERRVTVAPTLVDRVLNDLQERSTSRQEPGEQRFEPGYFQIVWSRLWEESAAVNGAIIAAGLYESLGGAGPILKDFTATILDSLEPAQAQVFWAISRYLVLPTGAKVALTVDDLVRLLRPSDFLNLKAWVKNKDVYMRRDAPEGPWLAALDRGALGELVRSDFRTLTASNAPLFQRVIRSDREEFELLHDLLGEILLEWRLEFERRSERDAEAMLDRMQQEARSLLRDLGVHVTAGNEAAIKVIRRAYVELIQETESLVGRMESSSSEQELLTTADRLWALLIAVRALRKDRALYKVDLGAKWSQARDRIGRRLFDTALHHPSKSVRVAYQEVLPFFADEASDPTITLPHAPGVVVRLGLAAAGIAGTSFLLATLLLAWLGGGLDLSYAWLTLSHSAILLALVYGLLISGSPPISRGIREAVLPFEESDQTVSGKRTWQDRLVFVGRRLFTWPLPALWVTGVGAGVAWLAEQVGLSPTPPFNVAVLFASLAVVFGLVWASDDL